MFNDMINNCMRRLPEVNLLHNFGYLNLIPFHLLGFCRLIFLCIHKDKINFRLIKMYSKDENVKDFQVLENNSNKVRWKVNFRFRLLM